jgi:hypothetical protein
MSSRFALTRPRLRAAGGFCLLFLSLACAGCGDKGNAYFVTGKVTYNGQPVAGEVVFVGPAGAQAGSPIADDGTYKIQSPPKGEVTVLVRAPAGAATSAPAARKRTDPPPFSGTAPKGVAPPAKYAQGKTGLSFNVTGGEQTYDIDLK